MSKKQAPRPMSKSQQKRIAQLKKEYRIPKRSEYVDPGGDHFVPAKD